MRIYEVLVDGKRVMLFRTADSPNEVVVTASGKCLWRRGAANEPVPPAEIDRRRKHRVGDTAYESQPVSDATVEDLKIDWEVLARCPHLSRYAAAKDMALLLRYWNLIETRNGTLILRRAALLLFAKEPLRWHANNRLRIRQNFGPSEGYGRHLRAREREIQGPILSILHGARLRLDRDLQVETMESSLFGSGHLLPQEAVLECVVNAVAHRNYAIEGHAIEVVVFPDRVEFKSPGKLPEPLTIDDLRAQKGAHRSRNPLIMRVLRDLGWSRDQGEGMRRIFGAMSQVELHQPELEELADTFIVRLSTRSRYDEQTQAWLAAYGPFGLEPQERKYVLTFSQTANSLSVDRLARVLGESFDRSKNALVALERKRLLWHAPKSRTYHLVPSLAVPLERAYRALRKAGIKITSRTTLDREELAKVIGTLDPTALSTAIDTLKQSGVLAPSGQGRWKLAASILEYARTRDAQAQ